MARHTINELRQWQALPLSIKIRMTEERIRMWVREYGESGVYVSFSGGKDSTVLLDIVRNRLGYKDIPAVFVDTGLEYPEIREFVKTFDNVVWLKPKMQFRKVIEMYGYPLFTKQISKRVFELNNAKKKGRNIENTSAYKEFNGLSLVYTDGFENPMKSFHNKEKWKFLMDSPYRLSHKCCDVIKKAPLKAMGDNKPITAQMACESINRENAWLRNGCNAFDAKNPISNPMAFWTEQDVLQYIKENHIPIASVYGDVVYDESSSEQLEGQLEFGLNGIEESKCMLKTTGCKRTGCMYCGFGCHLEREGEGRFERMKVTHPKQYEWIMRDWDKGGLGYKQVIDYMNENGHLNIRY